MKYVKEFIHRGLMFSGLGPIILGIVFLILSYTDDNIEFTGVNILIGIISTYLIAFVQAGTSVFHNIEKWSLLKSTGLQLLCIYTVYLISYLINSWIPFDINVIVIFTIIIVISYAIIVLIVHLIIKITSKKLNKKLVHKN